MTLTLGLHTGHEASAALLEDGRMLAAISNERLSRIKNDGGRLSSEAIDEVLRIAGKGRHDIDRLALLLTFFPEHYFRRESLGKELERRLVRLRRRWSNRDPSQMLLSGFIERLQARGKRFEDHFLADRFLNEQRFPGASANFYDHHDSHAMAAAYYSGFSRCAVVTIDGNGDGNVSHTSGTWVNGQYSRKYVTNALGASPGHFYSHITRLLGFQPLRHEGKIVGLAALGNANLLTSVFRKALAVHADGATFKSDFEGEEDPEDARFEFLKQASVGVAREDVAAAAQQVLEDSVIDLIRRFLDETGERHIALNGGVFANVKLNQRIAALGSVESIFVFPAMSDTGNAVGAALLDLVRADPTALKGAGRLDHVYWGPEYSDEEIRRCLDAAGVQAVRLCDDELIERAAAAIHSGKILGWFQGRMEFGPRALGNRSMLARPTEAKINDWLNQRLDRSEFMPFAPSVLAEKAATVFEGVEKARHTAEFMTITFDVRKEWRDRIPAVVHVDGTARPQLVRQAVNPKYHSLISEYERLSGIPLVLNTSFNVHEEPIVCAPNEAIRALSEGRVDCLAVGSWWAEGPTKHE